PGETLVTFSRRADTTKAVQASFIVHIKDLVPDAKSGSKISATVDSIRLCTVENGEAYAESLPGNFLGPGTVDRTLVATLKADVKLEVGEFLILDTPVQDQFVAQATRILLRPGAVDVSGCVVAQVEKARHG